MAFLFFCLLGTRDLALNGYGAGVAGAAQFGEDLVEVHQPFSDLNFFAQLVGVGGPQTVLGVHVADVRTQNIYGIHGIGFAVQNQVGGIETDAEVGHVDISDAARHGRGCLLAGFHEEILSIALALFGDGADVLDDFRVERLGRVFGNKAAVGLHLVDANKLGKSRNLAQGVDARGSGLRRHDTDGGGAVQKVPLQFAGAYDLNRGGGELIFGQQIAK